MKQFESKHYIFNFNEDSKAEKDIVAIAKYQENCFSHICNALKVKPNFKIEYFLCNTPEEVGKIYGDNEPCNGFASFPNRVYAVYNENIQCIGFHEDAHVISYLINNPDCPAIKEGLAMYFDKEWWGINNIDWVCFYLQNKQYIPINLLLDKEYFFKIDCTITYPIMGVFTDYLITSYGINLYKKMYKNQDIKKALTQVYNKSIEELNHDFISFISLHHINDDLKKEIENKYVKG